MGTDRAMPGPFEPDPRWERLAERAVFAFLVVVLGWVALVALASVY